ncbi:hypothetical protein BVU17_03910 [Haloarcula taiwanensis]|uniref:DUF3054 domain-containing protein n=1 Tax=Haloarcula taiwanensis TaxID=1932004 RepID=A0A2H4ZW79_9EURY|nr:MULTISPECIES: DUF3054 domain-containing protein [Haloarcula]AUG46707.1 hypothetical protein BVU17_03910 [Haloarcula taiwanensis]RLM36911.1 DUF3054 domain-containing protein [Haloarcula sp. Atlit-120R]RLM44701.1 DUF3054 domain-containing protein [Haloarcula sp. Atlit-47R]
MSVSTVGNGRIELSTRTALLAVGDLLAIAVFVGVGEVTHGINPILNPGRFAGTLTPFYIGWLIVAGFGGLYTAAATATVRTALGRTIVGWTLAVGIAQGLRSTALFPGNAALTFALVSVLVGGVLLVLWRGAIAIAK